MTKGRPKGEFKDASIGTIYMLIKKGNVGRIVLAVVENNANEKSTTLEVVEDGPQKGKRVKVDAAWLNEREPLGPVFTPEGEIVVEDGREFVRSVPEKTRSRELTQKSSN